MTWHAGLWLLIDLMESELEHANIIIILAEYANGYAAICNGLNCDRDIVVNPLTINRNVGYIDGHEAADIITCTLDPSPFSLFHPEFH